MAKRMLRRVVFPAVILLATAIVQVHGEGQGQPISTSGSPASETGHKVSRLGAINVPFDHFQWFVDHGYDFMARVNSGPEGSERTIVETLKKHGIEHFNYGRGSVDISDMGVENIPPERRGLKRGPGANKYVNNDTVCGGWDEAYRFCGLHTAQKIKDKAESGIIFEDYLNRSLCYCPGCEADYRKATGQPGFPQLIYATPHYEDTVAFDSTMIAWDQKRTAEHFRIMAEPIHKAGKKVMVAGVCRWIVGPEAAAAGPGGMFFTYYAGRRLPAYYMRNWKYWSDHVIPKNLWVIFGYFREYHPAHTRVMLANLPDGVNLAFWACGRQMENPTTRDDALYACDVAASSLVPIRIAVYDSQATQAFWQRQQESWRETHVDKAVLGFERLGFDAQAVASLDHLDDFELLYLEDVECLSRTELERIKQARIPVLATGVTGLRDETGRPWRDLDSNLPRSTKEDATLNLPAPIVLTGDRLNVELETLKLGHPWFAFMFDTVSKDHTPSEPSERYRGVAIHALSLIPSRTYGEFLGSALIAQHTGTPLAVSSETRRPMIVHNPEVQQVYSTVKFSDYVNELDVTECGYGYEMRQFCFLQIIDALTLPRRGVQVDPYLITAVRKTGSGHFLAIGNEYDEAKTVTVTLAREPKSVRINHVRYDAWQGHKLSLPPIGPKDAMQVQVDY